MLRVTKFRYYDLVIGNDSEQLKFRYHIFDNRPAQTWARIMNDCDVSMLRKRKPFRQGMVINTDSLVSELKSVVDELNEWLPKQDQIDMSQWDYSNTQDSVNRFHVHFPNQDHITDITCRRQLESYNDIIHEIEEIERLRSVNHEQCHLMICPDFSDNLFENLHVDDYQYFDTEIKFGDLFLGYHQIGRHPWEILNSYDTQVPTDQIRPQTVIGSIHYCQFWNTSLSKQAQLEKFTKFYHESKLSWPYKLDDPRLAFGYCRIGKLHSVNDIDIYTEHDIIETIRRCDKIINWKIIKG